MTDINPDGFKPDTYDVNVGGPINPPKPHIIDAVWTDDYGREYHVVGRERLTAAEDEIARLTIDLAETERERQKVVEREAKTAEQMERYRNGLPDGWFQTMTFEFAIGRGFPTTLVVDGTEHRGRDGSLWCYDEFSDCWELRNHAPNVGDLIAERDAAVARAERAEESAAKMAVPYEDAYRSGYDDAPLPTPDATNPAHCRFAGSLSVQLPDEGDGGLITALRGLTGQQWIERAKRLEAAQQQDDAVDTLRAEAERVAIETTDFVIDFIHNHWNTLTDVDAAKASIRPAIRDAVDCPDHDRSHRVETSTDTGDPVCLEQQRESAIAERDAALATLREVREVADNDDLDVLPKLVRILIALDRGPR